jgi:hypothetical protein
MTSDHVTSRQEKGSQVFGRRQRAEVEPTQDDQEIDDEAVDVDEGDARATRGNRADGSAGDRSTADEDEDEDHQLYDDVEGDADVDDDASWRRQPPPRPQGPWDIADVDDPRADRIDFGGLLIPKLENTGVQFQLLNDQVIAVTIIAGQSAVQLMAFAAPKTEGIWDEVRGELAAQIAKDGGVVDELETGLGKELRAQTPVPLPDGRQGVQLVRFIGVDGPRWFLRGVIQGEAAVHPQASELIERIVKETVVNRGTQAMAPRDQIPLSVPPEMRAQIAGDAPVPEPEQNPYKGSMQMIQPGPTITETR